MNERLAIIGLGYVGLPVALSLGKHYPVTGFDIDQSRILELTENHDRTGEANQDDLKSFSGKWTSDAGNLENATFYVVTVPTPITKDHQPDLTPLEKASETIGPHLKQGAIVVYESTVYPGVTEDFCGPILEKFSGLKSGKDFFLGYSPERINPGDKEHTFETIPKVIAAQTQEALNRMDKVYGASITAGLHHAPNIKTAETAKVLENTQRDVNIALMNELSLICDRIDIRTADVLEAARTKWNFLPFTPGLVGGHCIGVDPYYLTTLAERTGYHPQVIISGRRINDGMGKFVGEKLVKLLVRQDRPVKKAHIAVLGLTFKENVPDIRNSRVPDIVSELNQYGITPIIHDPFADKHLVKDAYGLDMTTRLDDINELDGLILAVPHEEFLVHGPERLQSMLNEGGIFIDIRSVYKPEHFKNHTYWSL